MADAAYNGVFARVVPYTATQTPFRLVWASCGTEAGFDLVAFAPLLFGTP